jgi:nitrous oxidase accessory protein NosD
VDSYTNAAITVRDSVASGNSNDGFVAEANGELNIENCVAANNGGTGVYSQNVGFVRLSNTTVTDNATGIFWGPGSIIFTRGNNTVEGNTATNGTFTGTYSAK